MKKQIPFISAVRLPTEDSGLQHSIVRLNNVHIDSKKLAKSKFYRRESVVIENTANGHKVFRYVMGNPGLSITKNDLAIDYDGIDLLGISYKEESTLIVRKASIFETINWFWSHPDVGINLSIRLGLIGAFLGVLGFAIGLVSLFS